MPLTYEDYKRLPKPWRENDLRYIFWGDLPKDSLTSRLQGKYRKTCDACFLEERADAVGSHYRCSPSEYIRFGDGLAVCFNHLPEPQQAFHFALQERAKDSQDYNDLYYNRWKLFYTFKAVVCILLNLTYTRTDERNDDWVDSIASWNLSKDYYENEWSWTELQVGYGVFKNWYYQISYM